jgi:hypothetical protein
VETDKGKVSIEDIKPGDRVLSRSEDGSVGYKPVLQVFMTHPTELMHLSYRRESSGSSRTNSNPDGDAEDGETDDRYTIIGTKVHRFWSVTRSEWIEMADLEVGERLLLADGSHAVIIRNELEQADEGTTFTTYNFEVPDWSSYYVAPEGSAKDAAVWVHNLTKNPCAQQSAPGGGGSSSKPQWLRDVEQGNNFNRARVFDYPYREVYIDKPGGGGYYRVDAYDPIKGEIISRKATQFSEITEETGVSYIKELARKYPPGARIADVPSSGPLAGKRLRGQMILEVPQQRGSIPQAVLDVAKKNRIIIRDDFGNVY